MNIKNVLFLLLVSTPVISWASAPSQSIQCPAGVLKCLRLTEQTNSSIPGGFKYKFISPDTAQEAADIAYEMCEKGHSTKSLVEHLYYEIASNYFWGYGHLLHKEQILKTVAQLQKENDELKNQSLTNEQLQKENAELKKQLAALKEASEVVPSAPGGPKQNVQPPAVQK